MMSTPAPPAGDQGSTFPPPTLSLAEPLPSSLSHVMRRLRSVGGGVAGRPSVLGYFGDI